MASLYKNNGIWYVSTLINGTRKTKSLKTKERKKAFAKMPSTLSNILQQSNHLNNDITFEDLTKLFLASNNHWSKNTRLLYERILNAYNSGADLPINPTSRAIYIRHINCCWNWGLKNGLIDKANKLTGDIIGEARDRVFNDEELKLLIEGIQCPDFNRFVRFAYYTGARSSEVRSLQREMLKDDYIIARGKTGKRMIKLNSQAKKIIKEQNELWNYSKDFISHKFKKECRKLNIKDARFHDLRRTFGYSLIKQGMSIYKVSKLLGHSSVRTTEKHYAPLMTTDIEEFVL